MNSEDAVKHRREEEQDNTAGSGNARESVDEIELVLTLVCLVSVRNSTVSFRSRFQVSDSKQLARVTGFDSAHVHRRGKSVLTDTMARLGATLSESGKSNSSQSWRRMDRWANITAGMKRAKKKERQVSTLGEHWEGWRESGSDGKWKNGQCERCYAETPGSSEGYDQP